MADLVASVPSLVKYVARLEAEAEGAARAERVGQMQREIAREPLEAGDPDAEDDDEELEEEDEEELAEEEAEWERIRLLRIEKGEELEARYREAKNRILDYDPKQGGVYHTRIYDVYDLASFDHDEESPIPPMRFTDAVYKNKNDYELCEAVNILSVKIGSLDIEFPVHVYGTVIARDSLDEKCVYLFRRDREESQTINSNDESLILTGPKRGLALISNTYVETNLIIKGDERQKDRQLSKGFLTIKGMERRVLKKCELESSSLATRLSTVDLMYGVVKDAVEATISIEVLAGEFFGEITACTSSIKERLVLHDRLAYITSGEKIAQTIPLLRSVVAVYVKEKLLLTIAAHTEDGEVTRCIDYTPKVNGSYIDEVTVGFAVLRMKVVWSIIDF